jgi:hypothetical protein
MGVVSLQGIGLFLPTPILCDRVTHAPGLRCYPCTRSVPRSYSPKHLAEKILTSRSALEGERKQVTVLFADVKGSMELTEQLDPEEWHTTLDRFFQILTNGVHRFEGTINQYMGDGIMALFGAPSDRSPEQREDAVPARLRDIALVAVHGVHHELEGRIDDGARLLGIEPFDRKITRGGLCTRRCACRRTSSGTRIGSESRRV